MKYITFTLLILTIFGCLNSMDEKKSELLENIAIQFFVDSLMYKTDIFKSKLDDTDKEIRLQPILDENLYKQGLFFEWKIATTGYSSKLTKPYVDSITLIDPYYDVFSDFDKEELKFLHQDFYEKKNLNKGDIKINVPEKLNIVNNEEVEFQEDVLFLEVCQYIKSKDSYYVQLQFFHYIDYPMYDIYDLYIVFDKEGNIDRWFFN